MFRLNCVLLTAFLFGGMMTEALPARIILIRHAEKPLDPKSQELAPRGFERAQALTHLFTVHPEYANRGLPAAYFAAAYTGSNSKRSIQTITPLATQYSKAVIQSFGSSQIDEIANEILNNPIYSGKVVMIAWVHHAIPELAAALGGKGLPAQWQSDVFDRLWIFDYTAKGVQWGDYPQGLLPGDSH